MFPKAYNISDPKMIYEVYSMVTPKLSDRIGFWRLSITARYHVLRKKAIIIYARVYYIVKEKCYFKEWIIYTIVSKDTYDGISVSVLVVVDRQLQCLFLPLVFITLFKSVHFSRRHSNTILAIIDEWRHIYQPDQRNWSTGIWTTIADKPITQMNYYRA